MCRKLICVCTVYARYICVRVITVLLKGDAKTESHISICLITATMYTDAVFSLITTYHTYLIFAKSIDEGFQNETEVGYKLGASFFLKSCKS